ncbi:SDR family oxidoreductase [Frankia sp. AgB1.9]|uniref:SDR family NAD(P)-dependent oxidoreductase n=1 Tax=unclassified Frankia TaxID=2632575 RepID=UPI001932F183|nr:MULTISPECIES: SDR family oxidoreductase [unclassified Frankia]MBL7487989.1 SDR family oxidoreductase [Frankia sp. AgW1.1]MBL7549427.1 SDR family oxidoreductase [Frankia sp. AgB1.9]MBL7622340.1 SDR family oxidoreductase [Frankia sp. AgB1.8]
MDLRGQTALVTGASGGIGLAFAHEFAARGADVVLVARSEDKLRANAVEITRRHAVHAELIAVDLEQSDAVDEISHRLDAANRPVDILVNNAGFATHGDVATADPARLRAQIRLNTLAVVDLTTRFLPAMTARHQGIIINVASTAAYQPVAHMAVYGATKAFVLSFTEALWAEAKPAGVRVLAVSPGATDTSFFDVVGAEEASVGRRRTPQQVVATALRGLEKGRPSVVDGPTNKIIAGLPRAMPRSAIIQIAERSVRPNNL